MARSHAEDSSSATISSGASNPKARCTRSRVIRCMISGPAKAMSASTGSICRSRPSAICRARYAARGAMVSESASWRASSASTSGPETSTSRARTSPAWPCALPEQGQRDRRQEPLRRLVCVLGEGDRDRDERGIDAHHLPEERSLAGEEPVEVGTGHARRGRASSSMERPARPWAPKSVTASASTRSRALGSGSTCRSAEQLAPRRDQPVHGGPRHARLAGQGREWGQSSGAQ